MVELAIVAVIASIILAALLKETDMIDKAKIERITADMKGLRGTFSGPTRLLKRSDN